MNKEQRFIICLFVVFYIIAAIALSACDSQVVSPEFQIWADGDISGIKGSDLDFAWLKVEAIVGAADPRAGVIVAFEKEPIAYNDQLYSGLTIGTYCRVMRRPCVLEQNSALIHELAHAALYLKTGDNDANHVNPAWARINSTFESCDR